MNLQVSDQNDKIVVTIRIQEIKEDTYMGEILMSEFTSAQSDAFKEFEDAANNQVLSIIDELSDTIDSFGFKLTNNGAEISDFQIFDNQTSFKIRK